MMCWVKMCVRCVRNMVWCSSVLVICWCSGCMMCVCSWKCLVSSSRCVLMCLVSSCWS